MRKALAVSLTVCVLSLALLDSAAMAAPSPAPQDDSQYQPYTPEQLDNLLAPIALYPDPLVAQVLPAATFVDQVQQAASWVSSNGANGIDDQYWDVSVKAVAHYPMVIQMMAQRIDWTTSVGQAYVNQSTDVMTSIQHLRSLARSEGNLYSTPQQQVLSQGGYIQIVPAQPQYIYVPTYDPAVVYVRPHREAVAVGAVIGFTAGLLIGAWLSRDCDWREHRVYYDGWQGGGWRQRSRQYVQVNNVTYVNNTYKNVTVNRTVVNRTVNVTNINTYNTVHRNVTYNNVAHNNTVVRNNVNVNRTVVNQNNQLQQRNAGNGGNPAGRQFENRGNQRAIQTQPMRQAPPASAPARPGYPQPAYHQPAYHQPASTPAHPLAQPAPRPQYGQPAQPGYRPPATQPYGQPRPETRPTPEQRIQTNRPEVNRQQTPATRQVNPSVQNRERSGQRQERPQKEEKRDKPDGK